MKDKLILTCIIFLTVTAMVASSAFAANKAVQPPNSDQPDSRAPIVNNDPRGDVLDSPGIMVGTTYYEYQTNGVTGNRVNRDPLGGTHFCWTNGAGQVSGNRHVSYNFLDTEGNLGFGDVGTYVNSVQGAGFTNLDAFDEGNAAVTFHCEANLLLTLGVDAFQGAGLFSLYDPPDNYPGSPDPYWPYITIDLQQRVHLTARANGVPEYAFYTRSDDGGENWLDLEVVDTLGQVGIIPVSSHVSDRVSIIYLKGTPEEPTIGDVIYIESMDGATWDFSESNKNNITNYSPDDTIRSWLDYDGVYDFDDSLHIIWNTPYYEDGGIYVNSWIWHWSKATGINLVASGDWNCFPGAANLTLSKPSIAVDHNNNLFVLWSQFDDVDVSSGGFSNGELYACASTDGGVSWSTPVNLTETPTPGCLPGDCESDHWSSMAEIVDDDLLILYINDKDAGAAVRDEGAATNNPVLYLAYPRENLVPASVDEQADLPQETELLFNYPNPFNASTKIEFNLPTRAQTRLEIYNILGKSVEVLIDEHLAAGKHSVKWDASDYTSGVYFYRLETERISETRRMVLLK
ncbi:MAG: T9SS type A sorting domain-containing protein [candidate division Zixibacteria bacterium]|nr:T9SS type A sorting domain-containing protein [candidate division Zixibacteria bacterium]